MRTHDCRQHATVIILRLKSRFGAVVIFGWAAWEAAVTSALREGDLDQAPVSPAERLLVKFVETLTTHAYRITDEQVQALRDVGSTEAQIAEAVYIGSYFNLAVRISDAFRLHPLPDQDPWGIPPVIAKRDTTEGSR